MAWDETFTAIDWSHDETVEEVKIDASEANVRYVRDELFYRLICHNPRMRTLEPSLTSGQKLGGGRVKLTANSTSVYASLPVTTVGNAASDTIDISGLAVGAEVVIVVEYEFRNGDAGTWTDISADELGAGASTSFIRLYGYLRRAQDMNYLAVMTRGRYQNNYQGADMDVYFSNVYALREASLW